MKARLLLLRRLIKCHYYYLVNKFTIILFIIILFLVFCFSLSYIYLIDERVSRYNTLLTYYQESYQIIKILLFFIVTILFGYSFVGNNDQYKVIIISNKVSRIDYLFTKVITIFMIVFFLYIINLIIIILLGMIKDIYFSKTMFLSFLDLFICCIYYELLVLLVIILSNNFYSVLIIYPLSFITIEGWKILGFIIPLVNNDNLLVYSSFDNLFFSVILNYRVYYLLIIFLLNILIFSFWNNKDFQC